MRRRKDCEEGLEDAIDSHEMIERCLACRRKICRGSKRCAEGKREKERNDDKR